MTNKKYVIIFATLFFILIMSIVMMRASMKVEYRPANHFLLENVKSQFHNMRKYDGKGRKAADIPFLDPSGEQVSLREFRGRYLLLNMWATWCPGCVVELPSLQELQILLARQSIPVEIIAVSLDREKTHTELAEFLVDKEIGPFALYFDKDGTLKQNYPVNGMPTTLLINPDGYVIYEFMGEADWTDSAIIRLIREEVPTSE